jgi:hypothetical protein
MFNYKSKYPLVLALVVVVLLLALPEVGALAQEECTGTVAVEGDLAVGVYEVPSAVQGPPAFALQSGDELTVLNRLGDWLLVEYGDQAGYVRAEAVAVPDTCALPGDELPPYLQQLVVVGIVLLGSTAAGPIITYITQIAKLILGAFGVTGYGGKIALIIGVVFVQVVIGANVLGVQNALTGEFETAARILGNILALLASLVVYGPLKKAGVMPGAKPE